MKKAARDSVSQAVRPTTLHVAARASMDTPFLMTRRPTAGSLPDDWLINAPDEPSRKSGVKERGAPPAPLSSLLIPIS
jgi:hypothetical protein